MKVQSTNHSDDGDKASATTAASSTIPTSDKTTVDSITEITTDTTALTIVNSFYKYHKNITKTSTSTPLLSTEA